MNTMFIASKKVKYIIKVTRQVLQLMLEFVVEADGNFVVNTLNTWSALPL